MHIYYAEFLSKSLQNLCLIFLFIQIMRTESKAYANFMQDLCRIYAVHAQNGVKICQKHVNICRNLNDIKMCQIFAIFMQIIKIISTVDARFMQGLCKIMQIVQWVWRKCAIYTQSSVPFFMPFLCRIRAILCNNSKFFKFLCTRDCADDPSLLPKWYLPGTVQITVSAASSLLVRPTWWQADASESWLSVR